MNLNELNTVQDLITANEATPEKTPAEQAKDLVFALDAPEALELLKEAVAQLASWHQNNAAEASTPAEATAWAVDEGRLHVALLALNEVTF